jgi:hypothetical protein
MAKMTESDVASIGKALGDPESIGDRYADRRL